LHKKQTGAFVSKPQKFILALLQIYKIFDLCLMICYDNHKAANGKDTEFPGDAAIPKVNQLDSIIRAWCP